MDVRTYHDGATLDGARVEMAQMGFLKGGHKRDDKANKGRIESFGAFGVQVPSMSC